jgi:hypothetical protein
MMGRVFIGILCVFLLLGAFATPINDGIKTWRTNDTSEDFEVTTAAAVTSANVTLSYNLYQEALAEVQSISSNDTDDTPVAAAYTDATKYLLVSGLDGDTTRTLTVDYYAETDSTVMRVLGPFLAFLIFGFLLMGIVWGIVKGQRR